METGNTDDETEACGKGQGRDQSSDANALVFSAEEHALVDPSENCNGHYNYQSKLT